MVDHREKIYSAQSPAPCRYLTFVYANLLRSTTKLRDARIYFPSIFLYFPYSRGKDVKTMQSAFIKIRIYDLDYFTHGINTYFYSNRCRYGSLYFNLLSVWLRMQVYENGACTIVITASIYHPTIVRKSFGIR